MREIFDPQLKARLTLDDAGRVRGINQVDELWESDESSPMRAALAYLREVSEVFGLPVEQLEYAHQQVSYLEPAGRGTEFRLSEEKTFFGSTTQGFYQTHLNVPVWAAGLTVTVKGGPTRVVSAVNTSLDDVRAELPPERAIERWRALFEQANREQATAKLDDADESATEAALGELLGDFEDRGRRAAAAMGRRGPRVLSGRFFVYRYVPEDRLPPHAPPVPLEDDEAPGLVGGEGGTTTALDLEPTLPLPPVDESIEPGRDYLVAEIVFSYATPEWGDINWRALVEVETSSILYLRALAASVNGLVFLHDPITESGNAANGPNQTNAVLNPFRDDVVLPNLDAPMGSTQSLVGSRAALSEEESPVLAAPTQPTGTDFDYDVRTNQFAAVNAYFHTDRFFALVEDLGFPLASYFNGTAFPVEVDHRGLGSVINAHCVGTGGGIDHCCYALAHTGDTANPMGIATDWRVHLHELGGHGILYEHVGSANFGFSHSAGDSFAMILCDPESQAPDRFVLAPFVPAVARRSDRGVSEWSVATVSVTSGGNGYTSQPTVTISGGGGSGATAGASVSGGSVSSVFVANPGTGYTSAPTVTISGGGGSGAAATATIGTWAWGGGMDRGGYLSEQILSTTMFRIYRSIGGDSSNVDRKRFAARAGAYLLLRAVGTLTPATNPSTPLAFANALISVDALDWTSEGLFGGAYGKVIRWSFEKQGLYQPGSPAPGTVSSAGQPPAVDVYIDDGRAGEYQHLANHWSTGTIWNRNSPDGGTSHDPPTLSTPNYAYVRIKNRGTQTANDVVVRAYHTRPGAGLSWPADFEALTTPQLPAGTLAPNNTEEKIVGPFTWTPTINGYGHDCMLMIVSATGDPSNADSFTAGENIAEWRLVPHDNNVGQRNVNPVPGGGGSGGLMEGLHGFGFWVGNPNPGRSLMDVSVKLPELLERRGWSLGFRDLASQRFPLKSGERRELVLDLKPGSSFERADVEQAEDLDIEITLSAGGGVIGGMTYRLDPEMERPPNAPGKPPRGDEDEEGACREHAGKLLDCLDLHGHDVKGVQVKKVTLDVCLHDEKGCC
ncbi:MAG: hypothetical protein M3279_03640 [Actinomycetota bacterium]|nr:hypothetical protein [Actinomycetota bacterium]